MSKRGDYLQAMCLLHHTVPSIPNDDKSECVKSIGLVVFVRFVAAAYKRVSSLKLDSGANVGFMPDGPWLLWK